MFLVTGGKAEHTGTDTGRWMYRCALLVASVFSRK